MESQSIQFIFVILFGSLSSFFLEFCFRPGSIFGSWIPWLEKNFRDNPMNPIGFLFNPLGGCIFCMNTWLTAGLFILIALKFGLTFWLFIPATVSSHLILSILDRIFWRD